MSHSFVETSQLPVALFVSAIVVVIAARRGGHMTYTIRFVVGDRVLRVAGKLHITELARVIGHHLNSRLVFWF